MYITVFLSKSHEGEPLGHLNSDEDLEGLTEGNLWIGGKVALI